MSLTIKELKNVYREAITTDDSKLLSWKEILDYDDVGWNAVAEYVNERVEQLVFNKKRNLFGQYRKGDLYDKSSRLMESLYKISR